MPKEIEIPTKLRAEATKKQYRDVVERRIRQVAQSQGLTPTEVSPSMLIEDFLERSQYLRAASIRYHRAALSDWIRHHVSTEAELQKHLQRLKQTRRKLAGNAEPPDLEKYTRSISAKDWITIQSRIPDLTASWPRTAGMMLEATLHTGLRPNEWEKARLIGLSPSDLEEIGSPWLATISHQRVTQPSAAQVMPFLYLARGRASGKTHDAVPSLIKVPLEATHSIRLLLDHIQMSRNDGKPFSVWLKEAQRGCRLLMKTIFPRRSWHYTLYSARYTYCKASSPKGSRSPTARMPRSNVGTIQAKQQADHSNPCKDVWFSSFSPDKKELILIFLGNKPDWTEHGKAGASPSKR